MKKLKYNAEVQKMLEEEAEKESFYYRYQDAKFGGVIPIGHISRERMFEGEAPEFIEEGASCYDNPWQLFAYMDDEVLDLDNTDVVLFVGSHRGYGLDEEDIVMIEEESDIFYSMSLRDFYKFGINVADDLYWNTYNVKEKFCSFAENFKKEIFAK